jgi:hypothetical protein
MQLIHNFLYKQRYSLLIGELFNEEIYFVLIKKYILYLIQRRQ